MSYENVRKALESIHLTQLYFESFEEKKIDDSTVQIHVNDHSQLENVIPNEDHRTEFITAFKKLLDNSSSASNYELEKKTSETVPSNNTDVVSENDLPTLVQESKADDCVNESPFQQIDLNSQASVEEDLKVDDNLVSENAKELLSDHQSSSDEFIPPAANLLKDLRWIRDLINTYQQDLVHKTDTDTTNLDEWLSEFHKIDLEIQSEASEALLPKTRIVDLEVLLDNLVLTSLAKVFHDMGEYRKALRLLKIIYERQKSSLGPDHLDTLKAQFRIASCLGNLKEYDKALELYRFVYKKQKQILGSDHEDTLRALDNIALIFQGEEKYSEALKLYEKLYNLRNSKLGTDDPHTLNTQFQRALCLGNLQQYSNALDLFEFVYKKYNDILGFNHAETLATQNNIAVILVNQEKYSEALTWYKKVHTVEVEELGADHPYTMNTKENIERVSAKMTPN